MNDLRPTYSLQAQEPAVDTTIAAKEIGTLFVNLATENKGELTRAAMAGYLDAVQDVPEWALKQACEEYRTGKRGDGRFVPRAGELAKAARSIVEAQRNLDFDRRRREAERKKVREELDRAQRLKEFEASKTPESRKRVSDMLSEYKRNLAAWHLEIAEAEKPDGDEKSIWDITNERFNPNGMAIKESAK